MSQVPRSSPLPVIILYVAPLNKWEETDLLCVAQLLYREETSIVAIVPFRFECAPDKYNYQYLIEDVKINFYAQMYNNRLLICDFASTWKDDKELHSPLDFMRHVVAQLSETYQHHEYEFGFATHTKGYQSIAENENLKMFSHIYVFLTENDHQTAEWERVNMTCHFLMSNEEFKVHCLKHEIRLRKLF